MFPVRDSTGVARDIRIELRFSEPMDRRSVQEALYVFPTPTEGVKFKWRRARLRVFFRQPLREDQTYVITVGAGAKDLRGNRLTQSFSLAFSTGDSLDRGQIQGWVIDKKAPEILIWAYNLEEHPLPDPGSADPDYITQCGEGGRFGLSYLSPGTYRLFAVWDKNRNRRYELGSDALGVPTGDIRVDQCQVPGPVFLLTILDTIPPRLISGLAPDNRHLTVRFSEGVTFQLQKEGGGISVDGLPVLQSYVDSRNPDQVVIITGVQTPGEEYVLWASGITDESGNAVDSTANSTLFVGSGVPDTIGPRLVSVEPADGIFNFPGDQPLKLAFSEALDRASLEAHFSLTLDSLSAVEGDFHWINPQVVEFKPHFQLLSRQDYRIRLGAPSISDLFGNRLADSLIITGFKTINQDTLGSFSGQIVDTIQVPGYTITAAQVKGGKGTITLYVQRSGEYSFRGLLPGGWWISAFSDDDGDRSYDYGSAVPFRPAERYTFYPDTVWVRSRWDTGDVDLIFQ